jgi:hypothetical protein
LIEEHVEHPGTVELVYPHPGSTGSPWDDLAAWHHVFCDFA